jgi:hypothetical protein
MSVRVESGVAPASRASAPPRPPKPQRALPKKPPKPKSWLSPLRRQLKRAALKVVDAGWFGFVPLEAHLVICGFPRSGTTLLQLMAETAYPSARRFGVERSGMGAANNDFPGDTRLIISKRPDDIFWIDEIRESYTWRGTRTRVRFIVSVRDPRAVLTSVHGANRDIYWVSVDRWRAIYEHYQYVRTFDDVNIVEYRDLVLNPQKVQEQLTRFIGIEPERGFAEFYKAVPGDFNTLALNGVRPLDPATLDKWRSPKHRARIQQLLKEMPELPDRLIEMGYEPDTEWTREYL